MDVGWHVPKDRKQTLEKLPCHNECHQRSRCNEACGKVSVVKQLPRLSGEDAFGDRPFPSNRRSYACWLSDQW